MNGVNSPICLARVSSLSLVDLSGLTEVPVVAHPEEQFSVVDQPPSPWLFSTVVSAISNVALEAEGYFWASILPIREKHSSVNAMLYSSLGSSKWYVQHYLQHLVLVTFLTLIF
jgi:hypothetical protein